MSASLIWSLIGIGCMDGHIQRQNVVGIHVCIFVYWAASDGIWQSQLKKY